MKMKIFKVQTIAFLLILLLSMNVMPSCKKDKTLELDITESEWILKSIFINSNTFMTPKGDFHRSDAYILKFQNDSIFNLPNNSNSYSGKYEIPSKGEVIFYDISGTRAGEGEHKVFNTNLMSIINEVSTYTVKGKTLTFKGNNNEVEFRKK